MVSYDVIEHGKPLQSTVKPTPQPNGMEVLVRITRCGVCHSDVHIWQGYFDLGGGKRAYVKDRGCVPPFTLGHEPFGVVEAVGSEVGELRSGQKGVVYPWIGCTQCPACVAGNENYCLKPQFLGVFRDGAYGTHVLLPHPKYFIDATGVEDGFAAILPCSGLTAYSALKKLPTIGDGDWIAILGCGGVGLMALSILKASRVHRVIACDVDATKLAAARALGADATVHFTEVEDALGQLSHLSDRRIISAVDFVGNPMTATVAIGALSKGGRYILCGLFGGEIQLSLPPIAQRAIGIVGSYVGNLQELREVVALARSGRFRGAPVETRPIAEVSRTLEELSAGKIVGRVVLDLDHLDSPSNSAPS